MSDFFTRLAERTLGLALIIQPFKPSLFAPESDADVEMPFEPPVSASAERSGARLYSSRPAPIDRPGTETPLLSPAFALTPAHYLEASGTVGMENPREIDRSEVQGFVPTKLSVNGALSQANLHQSSEQNRRRTPTVEVFSPHSSPTQEFPPLADAIESAAQQSSLNAQNAVVSQTHPGLYHESLPSQHSESSLSSNISATAKESSAIPPTQMPVGARVVESGRVGLYGHPREEGGSLLHAATPYPRAQLEASTPESAIQVTIGRVEVRAVTAPATTARSQQQPVKPPVMSLDEYLRRQEQGGRR